MICVLFNIKKCRMELLMLQNLWPTLYIDAYRFLNLKINTLLLWFTFVLQYIPTQDVSRHSMKVTHFLFDNGIESFVVKSTVYS